ncbi:YdcF family protein [Thermodesulfatator autotrophicus]|uniref:DUF218 domain-containing protein n=1 Tax=Thermodesulfatator autotrophicus TaxID=1795632 RepID=A0A177E8H4_9BACT|nr:YdcF family protein [Thermodesulfatator autotrophicus]OAG27522.1 hypothetical protein TH606_06440 [Thermodesulfatator autotrophicus]
MDLPFIFKKIVGNLLLPSGLSFLFLLLAFLAAFSRYRKSQVKVFLSLGFLVFFLSSTVLPYFLLRPLESRYAQPEEAILKEAEAIVLLPAYISDRPGLGLFDRIGGETAKRLLAAVSLARKYPEKTLIIVGAGSCGVEMGKGASYLAEIARKMGVKNIEVYDQPNDTASSARALKKRLAGKKFILVTAAYHMPRSVFLFEREGLKPVPYPAYYISRAEKSFGITDFWPRPINLFYSDLAVHEYLGLAFYKLLEHIP